MKHMCNETGAMRSSNHNGFDLAKFMKTQEFQGITGEVRFNTFEESKSGRTEFGLEILEWSRSAFSRIGYWDTTNKVKYDRQTIDPEIQQKEAIKGKTFRIVSKIGEPFLMYKKAEEGQILEGNERFYGYVVDLIHK